MQGDRRASYVKKWFDRGLAESDPFDRFFSLWICLIVAAQRARTLTGTHVEDDNDRLKVVDYFKVHASDIRTAFVEHAAETSWLAKRRGGRWQTPLVDTGNAVLREKSQDLPTTSVAVSPFLAMLSSPIMRPSS